MELVFVYNADSGPLSGLLDAAHKIVSPKSYSCNLCRITHGAFTERSEWKRFRKTSGLELVFLHRDEFERQYVRTFSYPVVLRKSRELEVFISTEELNRVRSAKELVDLVQQRVAEGEGEAPT